MQLDRKNPGIGDIVQVRVGDKLRPFLIVEKYSDMTIDGWLFGTILDYKIAVPFGEEKGQWRMKE